jgi:hypothetical protein
VGYAIQKSNRRLALVFSGFIGVVMGLFKVPIFGEIAGIAMGAGILLWFTALFGRDKVEWSSTVNYYGEILVIFGAMVAIGGILNLLLTF